MNLPLSNDWVKALGESVPNLKMSSCKTAGASVLPAAMPVRPEQTGLGSHGERHWDTFHSGQDMCQNDLETWGAFWQGRFKTPASLWGLWRRRIVEFWSTELSRASMSVRKSRSDQSLPMVGSKDLEENLGQPADPTEKAFRSWEFSTATQFIQLASWLQSQEPLAICHYVNETNGPLALQKPTPHAHG